MAIWLNEDSKILVQGMTGSEGTKHTRLMVASGANVVAGVTPGKAGADVDGIPVFNDVAAAMAATGANVSVVFVPPKFAKAAVEEAVDAQNSFVCCDHGRHSGPRQCPVLPIRGQRGNHENHRS